MTYDNWGGTPGGSWPPAAPAQPPAPTPAPWAVPPAPVPPPPPGPPPGATAVHWASAPAPQPGPDGGGSGRWVAVAAGVVCLVLVGVGLAWFLTGDPGTQPSADFAPAPIAPSGSAGEMEDGGSSVPGGPLQPSSVTATCQAPDGEDSAGNTITYDPEHTIDGRLDTAWRCDGSAVGARLVLEFDRPVTVTSVGLVPGYAKVDPKSGENRFTQNRTVTAATWLFDDGTTHLQQIPSPQPVMTTSDLASGVSTTRVVLQITGTGNPSAERDFTAVSDVLVSGY